MPRRGGLAGLLAAVSLLSTPLAAQTPAELEALFRAGGLTPQEIAGAFAGTPAVKLLASRDRNEIAILGIVAVGAPYSATRDRLREVPAWVARSRGRVALGIFGSPARAADAAALRIDPKDFADFRSCRPGKCDIKLPVSSMREFQQALGAQGTLDTGERLVRERLARYADDYRKLGTASIVEYADKDAPVAAAEVFDRLLADSPYLLEYVPAFQHHLRDFPAAPLPGASDMMYWATDRLPALRPIVSLVHAAWQEVPGRSLALLGEKQIYASHYFDGAFTLTTVLPNPRAPSGTLLIICRRMHFDVLPGGILNIRGRVASKTQDALREELQARAAELARS